ncbi:microtubule-associated protein RP/EB family member 2-like [Drosophila rhopaloa]|uniref:Microtubule-associated protein RP/EB family member 2-like n=1 Tax=Drosophila rhopaloa TaxID=1041015 RepID=A0A6P4EK93_DRORH|nr:microtubule-associated protein RP/EB family member 2-like [Drosophila rhopaloa]
MYTSLMLLTWVNNTLDADIGCIEDLATGAAYCQFLDIMFSGILSLEDVAFETNQESRFRQNFELLQNSLDELKIPLTVPVDDLVGGDFRANLDFAATFHEFFKDITRMSLTRLGPYYPLAARNYQNFTPNPDELATIGQGQHFRAGEIEGMKLLNGTSDIGQGLHHKYDSMEELQGAQPRNLL